MESVFTQVGERLHNRRFVTTGNAQGRSNASTLFHYQVDGNDISGTYQGGHIRLGHQVGRATGPDSIELLFHCLTHDGEMLAGWSRGTVARDAEGRTTLSFVWGWLSGAEGGGESAYIEVD